LFPEAFASLSTPPFSKNPIQIFQNRVKGSKEFSGPESKQEFLLEKDF